MIWTFNGSISSRIINYLLIIMIYLYRLLIKLGIYFFGHLSTNFIKLTVINHL